MSHVECVVRRGTGSFEYSAECEVNIMDCILFVLSIPKCLCTEVPLPGTCLSAAAFHKEKPHKRRPVIQGGPPL